MFLLSAFLFLRFMQKLETTFVHVRLPLPLSIPGRGGGGVCRCVCVCVGGGGGRGGACSTVMEIVMQEAIGCTDDVFKTLFFLEWICE